MTPNDIFSYLERTRLIEKIAQVEALECNLPQKLSLKCYNGDLFLITQYNTENGRD